MRKFVWVLLAALYGLIAAAYVYLACTRAPAGFVGQDFTFLQHQVQAWLGGAPLYPAFETAGPYQAAMGQVLYPPLANALFGLSLLLPSVFWWGIPIAIVIGTSWRAHPAALLLIAVLLLVPTTVAEIVAGNPVMWICAASAVGYHWHPAAAFVLLKPSLFPFALVGIRSRSWWATIGLMALASLPWIWLLPDWLAATMNLRTDGPALLYSLKDVPLMCIPLVAWMGRSEGENVGLAVHAIGAVLTRPLRVPAGPARDGDRSEC